MQEFRNKSRSSETNLGAQKQIQETRNKSRSSETNLGDQNKKGKNKSLIPEKTRRIKKSKFQKQVLADQKKIRKPETYQNFINLLIGPETIMNNPFLIALQDRSQKQYHKRVCRAYKGQAYSWWATAGGIPGIYYF